MISYGKEKIEEKQVFLFILLLVVSLLLVACGKEDKKPPARTFDVTVKSPVIVFPLLASSDANTDTFFIVEIDPQTSRIVSRRLPLVSTRNPDDSWSVTIGGVISENTLLVVGVDELDALKVEDFVEGDALPDNILYAPLSSNYVQIDIVSTMLSDSAILSGSAVQKLTLKQISNLFDVVQEKIDSFDASMRKGESYIAYKTRVRESIGSSIQHYVDIAFMPVPVLTEIQPVKKDINTYTPEYVFSSNAEGDIIVEGACSANTFIATSGINTIQFKPLEEGVYKDCSIFIRDELGRVSLALKIPVFTVDLTPPQLTIQPPFFKITNDVKPSLTILSSEDVKVEITGSCNLLTSDIKAGVNVINLGILTEGMHKDCRFIVTDKAGNAALPLLVPAFIVDITAPIITEVIAVKSPSVDVSPSMVINTNEQGELIYNEKCKSLKKFARRGNNRIKFWIFPVGKYNDCTIAVSDAAGNISVPMKVSAFEIIAKDYEAFWSAFSVKQGQDISLSMSTLKEYFNLELYSVDSAVDKLEVVVENIKGGLQNKDGSIINKPSTWKESYKLNISSQFKSGIYKAVAGKDISYFTVKPSSPGLLSKILVLDSSPTRIAYNNWGGKSLYPTNSTRWQPAEKLLLKRPGQNRVDEEEISFAKWATKHNIPLEYASMFDLHNDPELLSNYKVVVIVGHNEYWSYEMRNHFDDFIRKGGNAMILGGNTMLWQVRIDKENLICFKSPFDPIAAFFPDKVTYYWSRPPVNRPQNLSIGLGWDKGGYVRNGGYKVQDSTHWVYADTGVFDGKKFGVSTSILGYEVDGVDFTFVNGVPVLTGKDGAPENLKILALANAYAEEGDHIGHAVMAISTPFKGGGEVFNAGTIDWADGLWYMGKNKGYEDPVVGKITMNVIERFLGQDKMITK